MRFLLLPVLFIASCAVGPNYNPPSEKLEASYKNAGFKAPEAEGAWWSLFGDAELTRLVRKAEDDNPTARAALARFDQARASLGISRADAYPSISGAGYSRRQGDSQNSNFSLGTYNDYRAALNLSWEIDLWGRVRRQVAAARAEKDAAGFEYQAALLSLRGEVARAYLSLRFADAEIALLNETEKLRGEARRLMEARADGGASSSIDHDRSVTEHESVKAELAQLQAQRARFENALAALTGQSASGFTIKANGSRPRIPAVPSGVPSDLLRRRPDLAAAERKLAAASERIGVVVASYLPKITITGSSGVQSLRASDLFKPASKLWSLGPEVSVPLYRGGLGSNSKDRAEAEYREALENYREVLLRAVQETEDSLGDSRSLASAADSKRKGAASAASAADMTRQRYDGGVTDYFEVVDAERTSFIEQRSAVNIELARALAATRLIQSLGGGWKQ